MKLVYIANVRIPTEKAHGIQIMKMCEAFADAGVDVCLLAPGRFNPERGDAFERYGVKRNFVIKKIPCLDLVVFDKIFGNFAFWIQTMTFLLSVKVYLEFKKYDVIYTRERFVGLFFKNFVLELHSLPRKIKRVHQKIWRKAKKLVVLTGFIRDDMIGVGVDESKILVSPDSVDLKEFDIEISQHRARKKVNLPEEGILVGYVGMLKTMKMEKGIDVAVKSLQLLPDIELVLVGGQRNEIKSYQKLAEKLDVAKKVRFIPQVSRQEVPIYLRAFDILIAPYPLGKHFEYFMSPLKVFEYMAAKKPIVISDLPSIREILNESNAVLVKPGSPQSLAGAVSQLIKNNDLSKKIASQAGEDAKKYTWRKRVEDILEFINQS